MVSATDRKLSAARTTIGAPKVAGAPKLYMPSLLVAAVSALCAWYGWSALTSSGVTRSIHSGQLRYAGPVVLGVVAVAFAMEQIWPAQRRPILARGHLTDLGYLLLYATITLPLTTLLGSGFAALLERHAAWLRLPHYPAIPHWTFVVVGLLAIDATDWFVHLVNHRAGPLWRFHAVHHSQEEVSVLTTFRAHPLVHLSFSLTAVPGFVLASNGATPATLLIAYACLGALPHANVPWTYGRLGRLIISPAFHRIHHRARGRTDVNLGVVFPFWDRLSGRAVFPDGNHTAIATGIDGRPIPVEQGVPVVRLPGVIATQLLEPFTR